jgi:hypothetical protein
MNYRKKYLGHSLLELILVMAIAGFIMLILCKIFGNLLQKLTDYEINYHAIDQVINFDLTMRKLMSNINYGPYGKLSSFGFNYNELIQIDGTHHKLEFNILEYPLYEATIENNNAIKIANKCMFKPGDKVILTSYSTANTYIVNTIETIKDQGCKIYLNKSILSTTPILLARWRTLYVTFKNKSLYLNSGHNELWLSNIHNAEFFLEPQELSAKITINNIKFKLKWSR